MPLPSLTIWILAVYGLAFLLSDAKIFEDWIPLRPQLRKVKFFRDLLSCYFCMGIWISTAGWVLWSWPFIWRKEVVLYILAGSAGAFLIETGVNAAEAFTMATFSRLAQKKEEPDGDE
jgi:hypothetical protein